MIDGTTFILLTEEDEKKIGTYDEYHVTGAAINENGECISISSQTWSATRNRFCGNCTGKCSYGGATWTREDYRFKGIFTALFLWTKRQAGLDRTYVSKSWDLHKVLADKYGLIYPEDKSLLESRAKTKEDLLYVLDLADKITNLVQEKMAQQ